MKDENYPRVEAYKQGIPEEIQGHFEATLNEYIKQGVELKGHNLTVTALVHHGDRPYLVIWNAIAVPETEMGVNAGTAFIPIPKQIYPQIKQMYCNGEIDDCEAIVLILKYMLDKEEN